MIEKTYICNFCRTRSSEESEMVGLHWKSERELEQREPWQVDNHLCNSCWRALASLLVVLGGR